MVFFSHSPRSSSLSATPTKYQEEPDWAPAPQRQRNDARDASGASYRFSGEHRDIGMTNATLHSPTNISTECHSYVAAIKAMNDVMNNNSHEHSDENVVNALRGLWRVFDASVGELGAELNDSLSNKAIFEACIYQETCDRKGKPISQAEKNANASNRRSVYQSNLRSAILRIRGSFADVLLGAAKGIQDSTSQQIKNMEEEVRNTLQEDIQTDLQQEIQNRLNQSNAEFNRLNREFQRVKQDSHAEITRLRQDIEDLQQSKHDAVTKLSSTLETLQNTCMTAESTEKKLHESENLLQQALNTQRELRERVGLESERVVLLQNKLESETESKRALVRVREEIEKHLSLERKRADLLQQELESQKDEDQLLRREMEKASLTNMQLHEQLKNANEAASLLNQKIDHIQPQLDQSMSALNKISDKCSKLEDALNEAQSDNVQLSQSLTDVKEENARLEVFITQLNEEKVHLASTLADAQSGISNLLDTVDKVKRDNVDMVALLNEAKDDNTQLANALNDSGSEKQQLEEALGAAKEDVNKLSSILKSNKEDIDKKNELNSLLDEEVTRLENQLRELRIEKSEIAESLNECKNDFEKSTEVNAIFASKMAKLEATVEDQVLELKAAKLSESDVESLLTESMNKNEELERKIDGLNEEVVILTGKLRDECREKQIKVEALCEATELLNEFERIIKELEDRSEAKSNKLEQMAEWSANVEFERHSLVEQIQTEETVIKDYEKTLSEKNELLNEMSEVVEALKEQIIMAEKNSLEKVKELENNATQQAKEFHALNSSLEKECDLLRDKLSKCQEEYNVDRDKIAGALLGFDEEMTNAETRFKSVLDELEAEKSKAKESANVLADLENRHKKIEEDMKNLQIKYSDLELECKHKQELLDELDKKQVDYELELKAIKISQEKVDVVKCLEKNMPDSFSDDAKRATCHNQVDTLTAEDCMFEKNEEELVSLKKQLVKEKARQGRLQRLCFNARQDLRRLQEEKDSLESSLQQSIKIIKQMKNSDENEEGTVAKKGGIIGNFDQLCHSVDTLTIVSDDKGAREVQDFFTYIENQVTCADGRNAADQIIAASNSW